MVFLFVCFFCLFFFPCVWHCDENVNDENDRSYLMVFFFLVSCFHLFYREVALVCPPFDSSSASLITSIFFCVEMSV